MLGLPHSILDRIGGTPLVPLRRMTSDNGARLLFKLESENPTGSRGVKYLSNPMFRGHTTRNG